VHPKPRPKGIEKSPYGLGCIQNRGQKGSKKAHMASGVPKTEAKGVSNLKKKKEEAHMASGGT